jgi:hypothetical protein
MIVPDVHVRVFDAEYQIMLYELFHTTRLTRAAHLLVSPAMVFGYLAMATAAPFGGLAMTLAILGWYAKLDRMVALVAAPILTGMWLLAEQWHTVSPGTAGWWGLAIIIVCGAVASLSHSMEPLPPPWSGSEHFLPGKGILAAVPLWMIALLVVAGVTLFAGLELMSGSRILAVHLARLLARCGHRPELYADATRTAREILAGERVLADYFQRSAALRSPSPTA